MACVVYNLKRAEDFRDAVHHAVEALASGQVIALPTETIYGLAASALRPQAVQRLYELKKHDAQLPLAFGVKSADDALDYVPDMSSLGRRLARRVWPGPLTLVFPGPHRDSVAQRLPVEVRHATLGQGKIALRVPAHEFTMQVFRLSAGPVILTSASRQGNQDSATGDQVIHNYQQDIDCLFDAGPCRFSQPSTIAEISQDRWSIVRPGVLDRKTLELMSEVSILLVCTGNTCRSPMAEGLFKVRLAAHLGCTVAELPQRGYRVASAGVAAMAGGPASDQSYEVMLQHKYDLSQHSSQPITEALVQQADLILTMTGNHRHAIISNWPGATSRTFTLAREQGEISDPIGLPVEFYDRCATQMDQHIQWWIEHHPLFQTRSA
jgi:protein-tyrosine phosphatase